MTNQFVDVNFDFRTDATGPDPDSSSPTLRKYHEYLWSKTLPNGKMFNLNSRSGKGYLYHSSELGEFILTSDSVLPTYIRHKRCSQIIDQIPKDELEYFNYITYTIGGMMVFPGNKIEGRMTINGARGCNSKIADRFDLTAECIRRYYLGQESPLYSDLARYHEFFRLFDDFKGFVDFFLLQDLVAEDYSTVRFFTPTIDFNKSGRPDSVEGYMTFKERTIEFVKNRNTRIASLNL
jgi:hypothetical protein